jgi:predicted dehydrogenase
MFADSNANAQLPDTRSIVAKHPVAPRPIIVIGAGGIVRAAYLPAYAKAAFPVVGLDDPVVERAATLAADFGIGHVWSTIADAVHFTPKDVVYDIAIPAPQLVHVLPQLSDKSALLLQKPRGETIEEASVIRDICRRKGFTSAVNFSLRYAPNHLAFRAIFDAGLLGPIHDLEVQTRTYTPWHLWAFLARVPRLEILYHSIHYFDLIRSWLGNPEYVSANTVKSPQSEELAATKTVAILDYGESIRVFVATNHSHNFGPEHQCSFVQWEGKAGAVRMTMGVNLGCPQGRFDALEFAVRDAQPAQWTNLPISGDNFPNAFIGYMSAIQRYLEGSDTDTSLPTHFEDAYQTMQLVEALYRSSENSASRIAIGP